ncbi:hypothetical protein D9M69_510530 [compost metagenome]
MGVGELEVTHLFGKGKRRGHAQRTQARACKADAGDLEELTTAEIHRALLIRWNPVHGRAFSNNHGRGSLAADTTNCSQCCRIHHDSRPSALQTLPPVGASLLAMVYQLSECRLTLHREQARSYRGLALIMAP